MDIEHARWAEISLPHFRANVRFLKDHFATPAALMVAVKSNAYGHGQEILAPLALQSGADALAVLDVQTGRALRRVVPEGRMLCWLLSPSSDYRGAIEDSLDLGVSHLWQLDAIEQAGATVPARVHLKIDTGLHRNGCLAELWPDLVRRAVELERAGTITVVGIWSHLADTSVEEDRSSLTKFHAAVTLARAAGLNPEMLHIAASAASADLPEARLDMVRIGLLAYGVSPFSDRSAEENGCLPVMTLKTRVIEVSNGEIVLGMGYAHGLLPLPPHKGFVLVGDEACPIIEVEAEFTRAQASPGISPGDEVILFGRPDRGSPRAEDWASWANTIGDEVITAIPGRLIRVYREETA